MKDKNIVKIDLDILEDGMISHIKSLISTKAKKDKQISKDEAHLILDKVKNFIHLLKDDPKRIYWIIQSDFLTTQKQYYASKNPLDLSNIKL